MKADNANRNIANVQLLKSLTGYYIFLHFVGSLRKTINLSELLPSVPKYLTHYFLSKPMSLIIILITFQRPLPHNDQRGVRRAGRHHRGVAVAGRHRQDARHQQRARARARALARTHRTREG